MSNTPQTTASAKPNAQTGKGTTLMKAPEGFEDEQVGLPPYWGPDEEKMEQKIPQGFYARVIGLDNADEDFKRVILQAGADILCHRGPRDDAEEVLVKKGDYFTCSAYAGLPLHRYIGIPVYVLAKSKRKISGGRTVWEWSLKVPTAAKPLLQRRREAEAAAARMGSSPAVPQLGQGQQPPPALEEEIPF